MVTNPKEYMREYQRRRRAKLKAERELSPSVIGDPQSPKVITPIPVHIPAKEEPRITTVHTEGLRIEQPLQPEPKRESVKPETLKFFEALYNHFFGKKKQPEEYVEPKI